MQLDQDFGHLISWLNEKSQHAILWFQRHNFNQDVSLLKGALEKGFHPANSWLHLIAVCFAFASDVLKPLAPRFTKRVALGGFTLWLPPFLGIKFGFVPEELGSALIVFCLSVAVLSSVLLFLQRGHEHGALAELVPVVKRLQEKLGIIETNLEVVRQTAERTETKVDAVLAEVKRIAREKGVEVAPLRAVLAKLGEKGIADEDIPKKLNEAADELVKLRAENDLLKKGPPQIVAIATEAQSLIDKGEFDAAREVLARGRQAWKELRERSSQYEARLLAQEARIDHLQLAYRSAAAKYGEAAGLVALFDAEGRKEWLLAQASEIYDQGNEFGDNSALVGAVGFYRQCLALTSRERVPLDWAGTQNNLGNALSALGERESGTATLEEAVAAYRAALEERTRERVPLDWAMTQNNLGTALSSARGAGERDGEARGGGRGLSRGAGGIDARARSARLGDDAEQSRQCAPSARGAGERDGALEEAVAAYRAALEE